MKPSGALAGAGRRSKAEIVAAIEGKLDRADDPLRVRCLPDGRCQSGCEVRPWQVVWTDRGFLSTYLLARGYGRIQDDDVPF